MEGKLIKVENGYVLMVDNIMHATDNDKLSLKNCQAIANGYDLDELAENNYPTFNLPLTDTTAINTLKQDSFKEGFQKALEILGDKKFSRDGLIDFYIDKTGYGMDMWSKEENSIMCIVAEYIQSLQQTEWDVEIEMEKCGYCEGCNKVGMLHCAHADSCGYPIETERPKLDSDGCLILRRC